MKRFIFLLLVLACLAGLGYSGYNILTKQAEYREGDKTYEELRAYEKTGAGATVNAGAENPSDEADEGYVGSEILVGEDGVPTGRTIPWKITLPEIDFEGLKKINPDVLGWIVCDDTRIDYPIVQGETNDQYLHHMFNGKYNYAGSIFMECQNEPDFSDFNTILYGHHMRNGSMFHDLIYYKKDGFFEEHPYMLILTPEHNYVLEIFSGFVSSLKQDSWKLDFETDEERLEWLQWVKEKSEFETPVEVTVADQIVTLSTCTYEFSNARYVVYGILIEIPEENIVNPGTETTAEAETGAAAESTAAESMAGE